LCVWTTRALFSQGRQRYCTFEKNKKSFAVKKIKKKTLEIRKKKVIKKLQTEFSLKKSSSLKHWNGFRKGRNPKISPKDNYDAWIHTFYSAHSYAHSSLN
jgi:hypothetical protein